MTENKRMPTSGFGLLVAVCCLWGPSLDASADINLTLTGEVMAPPSCVINGGSTLNVPFGDNLVKDRIDGVNYRLGVPYTVSCSNQPSNAMHLTLKGTGATFEPTALSTTNRDLGIRLYIDGVVWPINTAAAFSYPTLPFMEAVPVRRPRPRLDTGSFSATATLLVELQ